MKLYSMPLSNFSTKSRIVIYEKELDIDIEEPPGGLSSEEYEQINPLGKIPALEIDGEVIGESEVINEYLEDKFPDSALLPDEPLERARVRSFSRFHDLYLEPPLRTLFDHADPEDRDPEVVEEKLPEVEERLDQLEDMLSEGTYAAGPEFTLADAALAPTIFYVERILPLFGVENPFEERPKLQEWWSIVQEQESVARGLKEQEQALAEEMG